MIHLAAVFISFLHQPCWDGFYPDNNPGNLRCFGDGSGDVKCKDVEKSFNFDDAWCPQMALVVKTMPTSEGNIRDAGSIPGLGRASGGWRGNLLQYSFLENSMERGAWMTTVRRVTKSQTQLKRLSTYTCTTHHKMDSWREVAV